MEELMEEEPGAARERRLNAQCGGSLVGRKIEAEMSRRAGGGK